MGMDRIAARLNESAPPLRLAEVQQLLGCSRSYLFKLIDAGALRTFRVGTQHRVTVQEAERIVRESGRIETVTAEVSTRRCR